MKKLIIAIIIVAILILAIMGITKMTSKDKVIIETNYGNITVQLDAKNAPITVANFKSYVEENFYDNTTFHRVIESFMIQGGGYDANTGEEKATKSPIKLESDNGLSNTRGTIAMARTSVEDSATSQFFINTADNNFLDYGYRDAGYAVFGKVIDGMDVVDKISKVATDMNDKPIEDVVINSISFV